MKLSYCFFLSQRLLVAKCRQHHDSVVPFPLYTVGRRIIPVLQPITTELGAPWIVSTTDIGETVVSSYDQFFKVMWTIWKELKISSSKRHKSRFLVIKKRCKHCLPRWHDWLLTLLFFLSQRTLVAKRRQYHNGVVPFPFNTVVRGIILVLQPITTELGAPWIVCTTDVGKTVVSSYGQCLKVMWTIWKELEILSSTQHKSRFLVIKKRCKHYLPRWHMIYYCFSSPRGPWLQRADNIKWVLCHSLWIPWNLALFLY